MPSTATTRNRLEKIAPGEQLNSWGGPNGLNRVIDLIDALADGWVTVSSTPTTLTSANYVADQARMRLIKYTGATTGTITVPSVEKWYWVRAVSADVVLTTGGGATATVKAGDFAAVACDGTDCRKIQSNDFGGSEVTNVGTPTSNASAVTKAYADGLALAQSDMPGQNAGTAYRATYSDGAAAAWRRSHPEATSSNAGRVLKSTGTDGFPETALAWDWDGYQGRQSKSGNYTVVLTDRSTLINFSAAATCSLTAAATLGSKFGFRLTNSTTSAIVVVDPNGSETINGSSTLSIAGGEAWDIFCDGSAWYAQRVQALGNGPHVVVEHQETSGNNGGGPAATASAYVTRTLNNISDSIGATLSSNQITLPAGTYYMSAGCSAYGVRSTRLKLYNVTDAADTLIGLNAAATAIVAGIGTDTTMNVSGKFTISTSKTFEFRMWITDNATGSGGNYTNNFGRATVSGTNEVYLHAEFTRLGA